MILLFAWMSVFACWSHAFSSNAVGTWGFQPRPNWRFTTFTSNPGSDQFMVRNQWGSLLLSKSSIASTPLFNQFLPTMKSSRLHGRRMDENDDNEDIVDLDDVEVIDTTVDGDNGVPRGGSGSNNANKKGGSSQSGGYSKGGASGDRKLTQEELDFMEKIRKYIEDKKAQDPNYDPLSDAELQKTLVPPTVENNESAFEANTESDEMPVNDKDSEFKAAVEELRAKLKEMLSELTPDEIAEFQEYSRNITPEQHKRIISELQNSHERIDPGDLAPLTEEEIMSKFRELQDG